VCSTRDSCVREEQTTMRTSTDQHYHPKCINQKCSSRGLRAEEQCRAPTDLLAGLLPAAEEQRSGAARSLGLSSHMGKYGISTDPDPARRERVGRGWQTGVIGLREATDWMEFVLTFSFSETCGRARSRSSSSRCMTLAG
jgi:hypothetical protein